MKREICCLPCADRWDGTRGIKGKGKWPEHYTPEMIALEAVMGNREHLQIKRGSAKGSYRCDGCFAEIDRGDPCAAVSLWIPADGQEYFEWESSYVEPG